MISYERRKFMNKLSRRAASIALAEANRPSLLYYAEKMTKDLGGAKVCTENLKREDLNQSIEDAED